MADSDNRVGSDTTHIQHTNQHSIVVRGVWFLLVGWWASGICLSIAWFLNITIIGIPFGIKMINFIPQIVTLKKSSEEQVIISDEVATGSTVQGPEQRSLLVRGVYFVLVGWWASGIWMSIAWLASITIIGLPIAAWMYNMLPMVVSLYRY